MMMTETVIIFIRYSEKKNETISFCPETQAM